MRHFLNDIEITPRNNDQIGLLADFSGNPNVLQINTDTVVLVNEAYDIVNNHLSTAGMFEGIPYRVEMGGVSIEYYVDLLDSPVFRDKQVEVKLKKRKGYDDFWDKADGTSFELMLKKGMQVESVEVPYFIIADNQLETGVMLTVTIYVMTEQVIDQGKELIFAVTEVIQAATPSVGTGLVYDTGDIIAMAIKVVARAVYFALLLTALIAMATKLFVLIFPPKRNINGVKYLELAKKACAQLGYTFKSDFLTANNQWTLVPVPLTRNRKSIFDYLPDEFDQPFNKKVPSSSDTTPTLGSFLRALETQFNGVIKVNDGIVRFEIDGYFQNVANTSISPALALQATREDQWAFNTEDVWKRYYIKYTLDQGDLHTLDKVYDYHDCEISTDPVNVVNADLVSIKGLNQVNIPFSLGARKGKLTWSETLAKTTFKLVDKLSGLFGNSTHFASQIGSRKDCMMISQQFFSVTKSLWTINGKQPENYTDFCSALALWNKYHYKNKITIKGSKIKTNVRTMVSLENVLSLLDNNYVEVDGVICEVVNFEFWDERSFAKITYKEPNSYAVGHVETSVING
jgi:hypothetical protein